MMLARPGSYWFGRTTILSPAGRYLHTCPDRRTPSASATVEGGGAVVGADEILVRNDVAANVGGLRIAVVGPVCVILIDGDSRRGNYAANENVGIPRHSPDVVVERNVAFEIDVLDIRSVVGVAVKTRRPIVEDDVVSQQQGAGLTLTVDPVSQIVGAAVVVDDGAIDLGPRCLRPDENSIVSRVMNDQIDELRPRPLDVHAVEGFVLRRGVRDLKSPTPSVRTGHQEGVRDGRPLAGILAHHDGSVSRTHERTREAPRVYRVRIRSAAQPDRAAWRHRGRAAQRRHQVPRIRERAVAGGRAGRRGVECQAWIEGDVGSEYCRSTTAARSGRVLRCAGGNPEEERERDPHRARLDARRRRGPKRGHSAAA